MDFIESVKLPFNVIVALVGAAVIHVWSVWRKWKCARMGPER